MIRQPVKSSHIASAGYSAPGRLMELEFRDQRVYQYPNIAAPQFLAFMSAPSKGTFFKKNWAKAPAKEVTPPQVKAQSQAKPQFAPGQS